MDIEKLKLIIMGISGCICGVYIGTFVAVIIISMVKSGSDEDDAEYG